MKIFYGIQELPTLNNPVITIGTFDGVHEGHKTILNSVVDHAKSIGGVSVLITFEPHPRKLLFPDHPLKLLSTLPERLAMIASAGIDVTVVVPFTKTFSELSAQDYIENFLVKIFHPHSIIIGYDHHFGNDRSGDITMLRQLAAQYNYDVSEIPAQLISAAAVSSTQIRNALNEGRVADANAMLGCLYSLSGIVVHGAQRGRTIGYPTANIEAGSADKLIPAEGVYAVYVQYGQQRYKGMMNIGRNPTVTDDNALRMEVNIFDFDKTIYGEELQVLFLQRLRAEVKFPSLDALVAQLHQDKIDALEVL